MLRDNLGKFVSKDSVAWKWVGRLWVLVFVMAGLNWMVSSAVNYHLTHNYGLRNPLIVRTQSIWFSELKKQPEVISPIVVTAEVKVDNSPDWYKNLSPLEKKVCDKWGVYECKNAVARCRAESGCMQTTKDGRTKTSSTNDIGAMQINEVHWNYKSPSYKAECDLTKIVTEDGNLECAMVIYKASGWGAWSTTHDGSADAQLSAMR